MALSLLDRSRTRVGHPDSEALTGSIERAVNAEALGYQRFWVAEHHAVPGIASGAPPVLLAAVGQRTENIRIGSGGVMLPNHQPFVVAEQFLMLEALQPGRIDLGLGRSRGFTTPVREALREYEHGPADFARDIAELRDYLDGRGPVTARPESPGSIPMFVLATGAGMSTAANLGLPVVIGGPILHGDGLNELLTDYRRKYRPSERSPEPHVIISLDATLAESVEEARELALSEAWAMAVARRTGEFPPLESPTDIRSQTWRTQVRERVETSLDRAIAGDSDTVRPQLENLVDRTGANEILASTSTFDRAALFRSDALLAELVGTMS
ncbi:MsnO8 family LLM class oxidoreductase [Rhodococcus sp. NPDC058521]|uniref:MsnO8 family LLM class oxidoreductase n=1 Tax=Rhodococcus sp. NPDC058521 TaxID=3346536 RepID=UPI003661BB4D